MSVRRKLIAGIIPLAVLCIFAPVKETKADDTSGSDDSTYEVTNPYTVKIPAEVTIEAQKGSNIASGTIPVKATLDPNTNLVVEISSLNNFKLINSDDSVKYSISDKEPMVFSNNETTQGTKQHDLEISLNKRSLRYSGDYTDTLTFSMSYEKITDDKKYNLDFDVNAGNDKVTITTTKKVLQTGENYGTLPTPVRKGYTFDGWYTSSNDQTEINKVTENTKMKSENVKLYAKWTIHTFNNTMTFWAWGFKDQEGNNGPGTALKLANDVIIDTSVAYGTAYNYTSQMANTSVSEVPNGYELKQFGSADIDDNGDWRRYNLDYHGIQPDRKINAEYEYDLVNYSITYNLNGGTNSKDNPSSYTILYGVTFKNPVKEGYTFDGWFDPNNQKITGINEGCSNDSFKNEKDEALKRQKFIAALRDRTIGNITLKAKWTKNEDASTADQSSSEEALNIAAEDTDSSGNVIIEDGSEQETSVTLSDEENLPENNSTETPDMSGEEPEQTISDGTVNGENPDTADPPAENPEPEQGADVPEPESGNAESEEAGIAVEAESAEQQEVTTEG